MNKKRNNKGFSLVELIVVIAVMAVLVGVLAPAYLRYVDKAEMQKDVSAVGEVVEAIKIAAAEESVSDELSSTAVTVSIEDGKAITAGTADDLAKELNATVGDKIDFASNALKGKTVTITVTQADNYKLTMKVACSSLNTEKDKDLIADLSALNE